jgi:hypothetical protein
LLPLPSLAGIWRLVLDDQLKVADIWFLRTLTREEKKFRVSGTAVLQEQEGTIDCSL